MEVDPCRHSIYDYCIKQCEWWQMFICSVTTSMLATECGAAVQVYTCAYNANPTALLDSFSLLIALSLTLQVKIMMFESLYG